MALRKRRPGLVYPVYEDWHYVGDTGEPAFAGTWTNVSPTKYNLGFRIRESGVVDMQGIVDDGSSGPALLFTLPVGYRPSSRAYCDAAIIATGGANEAGFILIEPDGTVTANWSGGTTGVEVLIAGGQFYLDPPSAP